jgi:pimeloyl-ACP methyl ester carboxylesterase
VELASAARDVSRPWRDRKAHSSRFCAKIVPMDTPTSAARRAYDVDMHCETRGEGVPLLLLHGFLGCGADWRYIFPEPAPGYRLIAPDLRGHGRSANPSGAFTFRQAALDVLALLDALGLRRISAIGLSGGGQTLLHMALRDPGRIDAMILVSTAPRFPPQARAIMTQMTVETRTAEEWQAMRRRHAGGDEQIERLWRHAHALKDSYDDVNFAAADLAHVRARTLIVHGDRDPLYPVGLAVEMFEAIPGAHLWIVPNGGHGPIFGTAAPAFVETALAFLRGEWEAQPPA